MEQSCKMWLSIQGESKPSVLVPPRDGRVCKTSLGDTLRSLAYVCQGPVQALGGSRWCQVIGSGMPRSSFGSARVPDGDKCKGDKRGAEMRCHFIISCIWAEASMLFSLVGWAGSRAVRASSSFFKPSMNPGLFGFSDHMGQVAGETGIRDVGESHQRSPPLTAPRPLVNTFQPMSRSRAHIGQPSSWALRPPPVIQPHLPHLRSDLCSSDNRKRWGQVLCHALSICPTDVY